MKILLYGYGNPGRSDDGLGNEFVNRLEDYVKEQNIDYVYFDSNYQLNIEDAAIISEYDYVFFIDASQEDIDDFIITKVNPDDARIEFTMHAVSVPYILHLCKSLYNKSPETFLIHIKGYDWDFKEGLSEKAIRNLEKSTEFIKKAISNPSKIHELINI
ncbi:MAG: hypothetical protein Kow0068_08020 [Marinilabiliales bacterium]